jgi:hypothetical protein
MSDFSLPLGTDSVVAATAAAGNLWHPELAAAAQKAPEALLLLDEEKPSAVQSRIMLARDRLNSVASLSEVSIGGGLTFTTALDAGGIGDITGADIQAFVAAAMASVGDQLAELAGAVEHAMCGDLQVI